MPATLVIYPTISLLYFLRAYILSVMLQELKILLLIFLATPQVKAMNGGDQPCASEEECEGAFPASIFISTVDGDCSAVKIGPKLFLTAAHCKDLLASSSMLKQGDISYIKKNTHFYKNKTFDLLRREHPEIIKSKEDFFASNYVGYISESAVIVKWYVHPRFNKKDHKFDLAVFEITTETSEIPMAKICPITLVKNQEIFVTGWGRRTHRFDTSETNGIGTPRYQKTKVFEMDTKEGTFSTRGNGRIFFKKGNEFSITYGDSGSGVFVKQKEGMCLVGINAFAGPFFPSIRYPRKNGHFTLENQKETKTFDWLKSVVNGKASFIDVSLESSQNRDTSGDILIDSNSAQ